MSSSFPKPARRRSSQTGARNPDDRNGRAGAPSRQSRTGDAARPSRPPRPSRSEKVSAETGERGDARPASGRAFSRKGEQAPPDADLRPEGRGGRRDGVQEAPVLPGIKPVLELLESTPERVDAVFLRKGRHGRDMERIVDLCRGAGVRFSLLDPASFTRVYDGRSQGVVARLFEAGFADLDEMLAKVMDSPLPLVVALDQVQDPGNAGTLARTLYALGGAGLVAPRHNGVYLGAAAAKAAAGALERLPVSKVANLGQAVDSAKQCGFTIYGAASGYGMEGSGAQSQEPSSGDSRRPVQGQRAPALAGGPEKGRPAGIAASSGKPVVDLFSLVPRLPAMLILGSEEDGMRVSMEKRCDCLIRIPMLRDFDSLNVAQAGGIIIGWFAHCASGKEKNRP